MSHPETPASLYGLMAEFETATELVHATERARLAGYRKMDAYSPIPIEELNEALGLRRTRLPILVFLGGLAGGLAGYSLEYWSSVIAYPMNVGGRPLASWTTYIIPSYELTILFAALTAAIGMIVLNGLPQPYHPVFNVERFSMASSDKFFLVLESADPKFEQPVTSEFLRSLGAKGVYDVEE